MQAPAPPARRRYAFGELVIDFDRGVLLRNGQEIGLRRQSFEVLRYLAERPGRLVTRDELLDAIWGKTVVTDGSLTQCLVEIRRAIGDAERKTIRTLPRRGYIFEAPPGELEALAGEPAGAPPPAASPSTYPPPDRRARRLGLAAAVLLVAAVPGIWWAAGSDEPAPLRSAGPPYTIAVLPFTDMSASRDQEYLSDGLAEEILHLLTQSPNLKVIARSSSFAFKDAHAGVATIAARLNATHVLEGSVRRSGETLRITSQLIDASTGVHVWSETYDRRAGDVLALQSDIASAVAAALEVSLATNRVSSRPASPEAYEHYLQGRFFRNRGSPEDVKRAQRHLQQALAVDGGYARAWAELAGTYLIMDGRANPEPDTSRPGWREAVQQALKHGPDIAEVHIRAAQYYGLTGDREKSREHWLRARALDPNDRLVLMWNAEAALRDGRAEDGLALMRKAVAMDPLSATAHGNFAYMLAAAGYFEEALAEERAALHLNPSYEQEFRHRRAILLIALQRFDAALDAALQMPEGQDRDRALAVIFDRLGRDDEAAAALARLQAGAGADADRARRLAEVHAARGNTAEAFEWLARGREANRAARYPEWWVEQVRTSPLLAALRTDPRWQSATARYPARPRPGATQPPDMPAADGQP